jgi:hypothetical protein
MRMAAACHEPHPHRHFTRGCTADNSRAKPASATGSRTPLELRTMHTAQPNRHLSVAMPPQLFPPLAQGSPGAAQVPSAGINRPPAPQGRTHAHAARPSSGGSAVRWAKGRCEGLALLHPTPPHPAPPGRVGRVMLRPKPKNLSMSHCTARSLCPRHSGADA